MVAVTWKYAYVGVLEYCGGGGNWKERVDRVG